jgi:putative membrane protein
MTHCGMVCTKLVVGGRGSGQAFDGNYGVIRLSARDGRSLNPNLALRKSNLMVRANCGPTLWPTVYLTLAFTVVWKQPAMFARSAQHLCRFRGRNSMIAHYTDHAANERTFLAWIRTGLAVVAFGFFIFKLNVLVDAVSGGNLSHISAEDAGGLVAVAARYAGLALVVTGSVIVARSSADFERRRRAIERDEVIQIPHSRAESLLSAALVIPVVIFCIYLALL